MADAADIIAGELIDVSSQHRIALLVGVGPPFQIARRISETTKEQIQAFTEYQTAAGWLLRW